MALTETVILIGLPMEEIDQVFSVPTKSLISYELRVWLPYFIKRHVFRQKIEKPAPIVEKAENSDA
ncbi:hypothetical protein QQX98_007178 [Neonectria punicea]|uniref:Uncharacterized protein n=1 Tax=Neonectria punicea TaxID=979145 RepID=A0ABR1GZU9_9HYPO